MDARETKRNVGGLTTSVEESGGHARLVVATEDPADPHAEHDARSAPHEQGPFIADHIETVQWRQHVVPLPPLSAQLRACDRRGLTTRADLIRSAMRSN